MAVAHIQVVRIISDSSVTLVDGYGVCYFVKVYKCSAVILWFRNQQLRMTNTTNKYWSVEMFLILNYIFPLGPE